MMNNPYVIDIYCTNYYSIAHHHLRNAQKIYERVKDIPNEHGWGSIHTETIYCIIFSALTLESIINDYGMELVDNGKITEIEYNRDYDGLPLKKKWMEFPKIATGTDFRGTNVIKKINTLVELRNKLVHHKPERIKTTDFDWRGRLYNIENAIDSIDCINLLIFELGKIDKFRASVFANMFEITQQEKVKKDYLKLMSKYESQ